MGDGTLGGAMSWLLWFFTELAFKWVPGTAVSFLESQSSAVPAENTQLPLITEPVNVLDVVHFLQITALPSVYNQLFYWWALFVSISGFLSLIFGAIIIYTNIRTKQIHDLEHEHLHALQHAHGPAHGGHDLSKTEARWHRVLEQANSEDPQGWRLAVLEADIMLAELIDSLGYNGDTLGDKMRIVDRSRFNTIDLAWEAHRFRNRIAHEGTAMAVEGREVRRIISLYEKVFKEFGFVA